jgi:hypothetical protein
MIEALRASLAATPQVTGVNFTAADASSIRVIRVGGRLVAQLVTDNTSPTTRPALSDAMQRQGAYWVDPVWSHEVHASLLTLRMPVRRHGDYLGMIVVAVSLSDLSRFLSTMYADNGISAFVLFDRTHVIAHRNLPSLQLDYSTVQNGPPLPQIDQVNDLILASIWSADELFEQMKREATTRVISVGREEHVILTRPLEGYGQHSWAIGIDFRLQQVDTELQRLLRTGIAGLAILVASVAAALFIGRQISRQIVRLAAAAESIANLDFHKAQSAAGQPTARACGRQRCLQRHGRGLALVRDLCAQEPGSAPDAPGQQRSARLRGPGGDCHVHRHPRLQRPGGAHEPGRDGSSPQRPLHATGRLHRGRERDRRQVHWRRLIGVLGRTRGAG